MKKNPYILVKIARQTVLYTDRARLSGAIGLMPGHKLTTRLNDTTLRYISLIF